MGGRSVRESASTTRGAKTASITPSQLSGPHRGIAKAWQKVRRDRSCCPPVRKPEQHEADEDERGHHSSARLALRPDSGAINRHLMREVTLAPRAHIFRSAAARYRIDV